ncbi:sphingomyelin phosphodiesterase [Streptomyces sp. NBC_00388]|uniref:sphingomyelin phosphodiesterase n=1 Tax=Streptomyces sp. NBC_00388 TaxID=2975735 RepID=UPI002E2413F1
MPHPSLRRLPRAGLAAALVAAALAAVAPAASAATAAPVAPPRLRVLTYNTFLMSKNLYPNWGQDHRAAAIPAASFFQGNDVVVLEEAFDNSASDALKRNASAQYPYQTPVVGRGKDGWDATGGSYSALSPEDGGVTLLSKWPVLHREQFIYQDACGSDALSDKGFLYAVLDVNGTRVHVVGTHTQSDDTACGAGEAAGDRSLQLKQIDAFLAAKNIPADEEVMVAGDLNIDSRSAEYTSMLRDGGLVAADSRTGHPYSFDTQENSVASYRYPGDPRQDLDYVLHRAGHARPSGWRNEVVKEESAPWTVRSWGTDYTYTNLSDHYPLIAGG